MKNANEQTLKEAIEQMLKSYKVEKGMNETKIINSWEKITGKMITNHTKGLYIKNKQLYIKLDSPALKHELSFSKTELIKMLNETVNQKIIEDIIFI